MKVINKTKEFNAIEIDDSREFYINVGKYLSDDEYEIEDKGYCSNFKLINNDGSKTTVKQGGYILIDTDMKTLIYISRENFKENYVEIKEEK